MFWTEAGIPPRREPRRFGTGHDGQKAVSPLRSATAVQNLRVRFAREFRWTTFFHERKVKVMIRVELHNPQLI
jgi:hypothetical protein